MSGRFGQAEIMRSPLTRSRTICLKAPSVTTSATRPGMAPAAGAPDDISTLSGLTQISAAPERLPVDATGNSQPDSERNLLSCSARGRNRAMNPIRPPHEIRDETRVWTPIHIIRPAGLHDGSTVHHEYALSQAHRLLLVVGYHDCGRADRGEHILQFGAQLMSKFGVERRQGLIQKNKARMGGERPRKRNTLLLAAAQLVRSPLSETDEPDELEHLGNAARYLPRRMVAMAKPVADVLFDGHMREKSVVLEQQPDIALIGFQSGHRLAVDQDRAFVGPLESGDEPKNGGLAAAARSKQCDCFTWVHREGDITERDRFAEALADPLKFHGRNHRIVLMNETDPDRRQCRSRRLGPAQRSATR